MKGIQFKDQNCVFGKPSTMSEGECNSLHTKKTTNGNWPAVESVWELSDEELALVMKSKRIRLGIVGKGMPPVYMAVEPFEVCGVDLDWKIRTHESDLSIVMKSEEVRFIGDYMQCKSFISEHGPKNETSQAEANQPSAESKD